MTLESERDPEFDPSEPVTTDAPEDDVGRVMLRHRVGRTLADSGFGDTMVLSREQIDEALTPARREILNELVHGPPESIRDLARTLDRGAGNVKNDLDVLAKHHLVSFETEGQRKRPYLEHDTVVVEPVVARSVPVAERPD